MGEVVGVWVRVRGGLGSVGCVGFGPTPPCGHPSRGDLLQARKLRVNALDPITPYSQEKSPLEGWRVATGWIGNVCYQPTSHSDAYTVGLRRRVVL